MAYTLVQIFFWLALSTWFGAVIFVAMAPRIILKTVRESNPLLPTVLSVNLDGQHGEVLAGSIIGNLISPLIILELICAAVLLPSLIGQWFVLSPHGPELFTFILRTLMYFGATILVIYDWRIVWPQMWKSRQEYLDHADEPEVANPALDQLNKYQSNSITVLLSTMFLLIGIILFSAGVVPATAIIITK